jgi:signal transduction histidine kinase
MLKFFLLIFLTVCCAVHPLSSQSIYTRWSDVPVMHEPATSPDSLQGMAMLNHLMALEMGRLQRLSVYTGRDADLMDSLAVVFKAPFARGLALFVRSVPSTMGALEPVITVSLKHAEQALEIFSDLKDSAAIFHTYILLGDLELYLQRMLYQHYNQEPSNEKEKFKMSRTRYYYGMAAQYLPAVEKEYGHAYLQQKLFRMEYAAMTEHHKTDSLIMAGKRLMRQVSAPELLLFKTMIWYAVSNLQFISGEVALSVQQKKEMLSSISSPDCYMRYIILGAIANEAPVLKQYDTAYAYARQAEAFSDDYIKKVNFNDKLPLEVLIKVFNERGDYRQKAMYLEKYQTYQEAAYRASRDLDYITYENELLLLKTEEEKMDLKIANRNRGIYIGIGIIALILASLFAVYQYHNKRKMSKAYAEINRLQHARQRLFGIIAHDLRNPIENYQGLAELMAKLVKKGEWEALNNISSQIENTGSELRRMLDHLLKWSLGELSGKQVDKRSCRLSKILEETLMANEPIIKEKHLNIDKEADPLVEIVCSPNYLNTLLRNLISNALQAAPRYSNISIRCGAEDGYCRLSIGNAVEIRNESAIAQLDAFFNRRENFEPGEGSFGFGSILIRQAVDILGGKIQFNDEGNRLIFNVTLPFS